MTSPPGVPMTAYALLTNPQGRHLLVLPRGGRQQPWRLPGGLVEHGEAPTVALRRELAEELQLVVEPGPLLGMEWVAPRGSGPRPRLAFLFGTRPLTRQEADGIVLQYTELQAARWVSPEQAVGMLHERHAVRLAEALTTTHATYREHHPKGHTP